MDISMEGIKAALERSIEEAQQLPALALVVCTDDDYLPARIDGGHIAMFGSTIFNTMSTGTARNVARRLNEKLGKGRDWQFIVMGVAEWRGKRIPVIESTLKAVL